MKKLASFVLVALLTNLSTAFADLFPVREGNWWNFNFTIAIDGNEGSEFDSGTVQWRIIQLVPGDDALYQIKIQQRRDLVRSRNNYIKPVDSFFDPPRTTFDTLLLPANYLSNGLTFINDSCIALLHEPQCLAHQCTLSTTQIQYHGKTITGYIIDPLPCRIIGTSTPECVALKRFTQADGIGPVAFESSLSPCVFDLSRDEHWTLLDHRASNRWISPDTAASGTSSTLMLSTLEYVFEPSTFIQSIAIDSNGIFLTYLPVYDPDVRLAALYGHASQINYQFTAPKAGKYPVFAESRPIECPTCGVSLPIVECIDTLVVTDLAAIKGRAMYPANGKTVSVRKANGLLILDGADEYTGSDALLLDVSGRVLFRARIDAGKAVFNTKTLSPGRVVVICVGKKGVWRCVFQ